VQGSRPKAAFKPIGIREGYGIVIEKGPLGEYWAFWPDTHRMLTETGGLSLKD